MPSKEKSNFQLEFYDKIYLTSRVLKRYFTRHLHSRNEAGTTNFEMNLREKYLQIGSRWMLSWCYSAPKGPMSEKVMWGLELIWSLSLSLSLSQEASNGLWQKYLRSERQWPSLVHSTSFEHYFYTLLMPSKVLSLSLKLFQQIHDVYPMSLFSWFEVVTLGE